MPLYDVTYENITFDKVGRLTPEASDKKLKKLNRVLREKGLLDDTYLGVVESRLSGDDGESDKTFVAFVVQVVADDEWDAENLKVPLELLETAVTEVWPSIDARETWEAMDCYEASTPLREPAESSMKPR